MSERFTKVKLLENGSKVHLAYQKLQPAGEPDEFTMTSSDQPAPEFREALNALVPEVLKILQLPTDYGKGMEVSGVSFSYGGDSDVMGATITARKTLDTANSPLILNTPHLPCEPYSETDMEAPTLPPSTIDALGAVEAEALRYLVGDRAQGNLFAVTIDKSGDEAPVQ